MTAKPELGLFGVKLTKNAHLAEVKPSDWPKDRLSESQLSDMHGRAGFANVTSHPVPMSPHTVVLEKADK